jgi:hypothetical protein
MPYRLKPVRGGYFVVDRNGHKYSIEPLSLEMAHKQITALNLAHLRKMGYVK